MSGWTSGLPYGVFIRRGNTWFITAKEPLSYEPAGSSLVTLSVVPMVRVPPDPAAPDCWPEEEDPPPPQAVRTRAAAARPAKAATEPRRRCEMGNIRKAP